MVARIPDWLSRLRTRLYAQYRDQPAIESIVQAVAAAYQPLEDAAVAMQHRYRIDPLTDDATSYLYAVGRGAWLDLIGRIVGWPRAGLSDDAYRYYLRAAVAAGRSSGTRRELYHLGRLMFGPLAAMRLEDSFPAGFVFHLQEPEIPAYAAPPLRIFYAQAHAAGVAATIRYKLHPTARTFRLGDVATYPSGATGRGLGDLSNPGGGGLLSAAEEIA